MPITGSVAGLARSHIGRAHICIAAALTAATSLSAQWTDTWVVMNHGRDAGSLTATHMGDSVTVRLIYTDRNRGGRVETRYRLAANRSPVTGEQRTILPDGNAGPPIERFELIGDSVRVTLGSGPSQTRPHGPGNYTGLRGGTPYEQAVLARHLLSRPQHRDVINAAGEWHAEVIADTTLRLGNRRQRARLVMVYRGANANPTGVWLDQDGFLLATDVQWFITVKRGAEALLRDFRAIELRWRDAQGEAIGRTAVTPTSGTIAINGDLFDSDAGVMRPNHTVIVRGSRITDVGPAADVAMPADATVIDARGRTVMPGMWDMHTHSQVASQSWLGRTQLANGLTTVRDLASDVDVAVSLRDREAAGRLASPRVILGGFIEGPLAWAGPTEAIARTEAEARAWVARYDSLGYKQIKLYNVLHPDLVPVIAAEAKKRGMLLSGHIPRGMSIEAAVTLGFDEIQHAAFFFSNFFPDSLYLPRMRAYSQVATAVAPTFDVNSAGMTKLLEFLKAKGTAVDGTFNLWIGGGGAVVGAGGSMDQQRADSAYLTLIRRLYAYGIPLIAGTDNSSGSTFRRELEMYELAGIPAARVLQIATIDAARFMRDSKDYGSIAAGKVADILIVNGKPAERIGDLQHIETVLRGGRRYDVAKLRAGLGPTTGANGAEGESLSDDHGHTEPPR
jgi:Amidohydrolase family